jgi:broad specificity phosphatase PhoE
MSTLLLVRHGETDWNRSGQIMGEKPVPLNRTGEAQARHLATLLEGRTIGALYSSPVARARQTAEILAATLKVPVTTDRGLTEIGVGEWEGRYWQELADDLVRLNFYAHSLDARPPGGETLREVQERAVATVERACTQTGSDPLLLVSHADVLRTILAHYLRLDLQRIRQIRVAHAALTALEVRDGTAELLCVNYPTDLAALG